MSSKFERFRFHNEDPGVLLAHPEAGFAAPAQELWQAARVVFRRWKAHECTGRDNSRFPFCEVRLLRFPGRDRNGCPAFLQTEFAPSVQRPERNKEMKTALHFRRLPFSSPDLPAEMFS